MNAAPTIAVTGRTGQVVTALKARAGDRFAILALGRPEVDLADPDACFRALVAAQPAAIVNAAAYTAVDKAESEPEIARRINALGAEAAARAAAELGAPIVQISTDYVFAGDGSAAYGEGDPTGPKGVYGATKLEGERRVAQANPDHAILRTSWVHAPWGANFVRTMLRVASSRDTLGVVDDQHGAPTSALDIAEGILAVVANLVARRDEAALRGVFHMTAAGTTSWAGFAEAVFAESARLGGPTATVNRIATRDYPTPAARPANSRLDCRLIAARHGVALPDWRSAVEGSVAGILADMKTGGQPT